MDRRRQREEREKRRSGQLLTFFSGSDDRPSPVSAPLSSTLPPARSPTMVAQVLVAGWISRIRLAPCHQRPSHWIRPASPSPSSTSPSSPLAGPAPPPPARVPATWMPTVSASFHQRQPHLQGLLPLRSPDLQDVTRAPSRPSSKLHVTVTQAPCHRHPSSKSALQGGIPDKGSGMNTEALSTAPAVSSRRGSPGCLPSVELGALPRPLKAQGGSRDQLVSAFLGTDWNPGEGHPSLLSRDTPRSRLMPCYGPGAAQLKSDRSSTEVQLEPNQSLIEARLKTDD